MKKVIVETSARHVHLSEADLKVLLGEGQELTIKKMLSQPGQFASNERVNLVGPKKAINNVLILGPVRKETQVEITKGVIAAKRHVHLDTATAEEMGLKDKQVVSVKVGGERGLTFGEVVVRVNPNFAPAVHLDTDEANAAALSGEVFGEIIV